MGNKKSEADKHAKCDLFSLSQYLERKKNHKT